MRLTRRWTMRWAVAGVTLALACGGWAGATSAEDGSTIVEQDLPPPEHAEPAAPADAWEEPAAGGARTTTVETAEGSAPAGGAADKVEGSMEHAGDATRGGLEKAGAATGKALDKAITKTGEGVGYVIDKTGKGLKSAGEALSGEER